MTITLGGVSTDSTNTVFDGTYSFSDLKGGSYTLTPSKDKFTFKPKSLSPKITTEDIVSQNFTLQTFTISGAVKTKKGEPADGVSMVLSGESSDTTDTASDGTYSFSDLGNGNYTVTPTLNTEWYYISPPFKSVLLNGKDTKNVNFTGKTPHDISGRILQGTTPVVWATLILTNSTTNQTAQATTDSEGHYEFNSLLEGSYVVTPSLAGYIFKPVGKKVKLQDSDIADVDFSATAVYSISGTVTGGGRSPFRGSHHSERQVHRQGNDRAGRVLFVFKSSERLVHCNSQDGRPHVHASKNKGDYNEQRGYRPGLRGELVFGRAVTCQQIDL